MHTTTSNKGSLDRAIDYDEQSVHATSHMRNKPCHKQDDMAVHVVDSGKPAQPTYPPRRPDRSERNPKSRYGNQCVYVG